MIICIKRNPCTVRCVCVTWSTVLNGSVITLCWTFNFLSFFLGRACQRNDLASLATASVTPQPIVALENCLGFRIVPSSGHGIVCDQYCFFSFWKWLEGFFQFLWLFKQPPKHTNHNPTSFFRVRVRLVKKKSHSSFYPSALFPYLISLFFTETRPCLYQTGVPLSTYCRNE